MARFMNWNAWAAFVVLVEQVQPGLDPLERRAATSNRLLGGVLEGRQSLGGIGDPFFFPVDPVLVGFDQRLELRAVLLRVGLGQQLHVEDQPLQLGEGRVDLGVFGPGRGRPGNLVARHDLGADPHGMVRVGRHIDMDADAMPHGELDVPTIEHRQQIVLGLHCRVGAAEFEDRVPLVDDRRTVHALGHQFRLEDPGGVLQLLRLLLLVDQEQRDAPVIACVCGRVPGRRLPGSWDRRESAGSALP